MLSASCALHDYVATMLSRSGHTAISYDRSKACMLPMLACVTGDWPSLGCKDFSSSSTSWSLAQTVIGATRGPSLESRAPARANSRTVFDKSHQIVNRGVLAKSPRKRARATLVFIPLLILGCSACSGRILTRAARLVMNRRGDRSLSLCESSPVPRSCCLHLQRTEGTKDEGRCTEAATTPTWA